jgi:multidrug efflux pump subunit AcrA (membrane-fusion protein)
MKLALLVRYATFILAIAGVIVMTSVMQTIHGQDNATIPPPPVTPPVKPYSGGVAATGIIEALSENVAIGVPAPGIISEVKVRVWDKVKKDDVLLVIDDRELRAALGKQNAAIAVSQANLDVSLAQLNKSRATLDRLKSENTTFIITLPLRDMTVESSRDLRIVGTRLQLIDRFNNKETMDMLSGNVSRNLFKKDLLVEVIPTAP